MKAGKTVVVGAGAAGLSAAWTLKKHGVDAVVLEAGDRTGGDSRPEGVTLFPGSAAAGRTAG